MVAKLIVVVGCVLAALWVLEQCGLFHDDPPDDDAPGGVV